MHVQAPALSNDRLVTNQGGTELQIIVNRGKLSAGEPNLSIQLMS